MSFSGKLSYACRSLLTNILLLVDLKTNNYSFVVQLKFTSHSILAGGVLRFAIFFEIWVDLLTKITVISHMVSSESMASINSFSFEVNNCLCVYEDSGSGP